MEFTYIKTIYVNNRVFTIGTIFPILVNNVKKNSQFGFSVMVTIVVSLEKNESYFYELFSK